MARLIKRYENRKLYDTEASGYVSQMDIARLVRSGETVQVVDNVSGDDITAQVLTQIMLEEGKQGDQLLPTELLHDLLRKGGEAAASSLEQLRHSVDDFVQHSVNRLAKLVNRPRSDEIDTMQVQLDELEGQLNRLLRVLKERREQQNETDAPSDNDVPPSHTST